MKLSDKINAIRASATLSISARAAKMKAEGIDIISFGAGEPDFDTPDFIKQAAIKAINENYTHYTAYEGCEELRRAIADKLKRENNLDYDYTQIVVSNGSKHALNNAFAAILDPGDEVIVPAPFWLSYIEIIKMEYGVPVIVNTYKEKSFKVNSSMLEKVLTDKTKALIINSPNNPTGMVYTESELKDIADFALKHDLFVISDEIYEKLIYSHKLRHISIASLNDEIYKRTIVINGLSKSHAMTGWRVGYTASSKEIAKAIGSMQSHSTSNVNSIAQKAAIAALTGDQSYVEQMLTEFKHRRDYIAQRISDIPLLSSLLPKGAFYLFVDISKLCSKTIDGIEIKDSEDVAKILLERYRVAVVPCNVFGYENYIRISYATSMSNIVEGVNRIEKFVKQNF